MNITEDQFRKTLGLFPTGVTVATTSKELGHSTGITISSFTSVSLDPPQVLFCLSKKSKKMAAFEAARHFAINILKVDQSHLSDGFATRGPLDQETITSHDHPETGCLLISDALGHVICEKKAMYDGGDHYIILGGVIDLTANPNERPLIRHKGRYLTVQPHQDDSLKEHLA